MKVIDSLKIAMEGRGRAGRSFVTLSYAQSLDGCISARGGESLALSGQESLVLTHELRARHDAILVGIGTVLSDNPRLSVRLCDGDSPQRIVLDSRLRTPVTANLLNDSGRCAWVATRGKPPEDRVTLLEKTGAQIISVRANARGQVSLTALLDRLGSLGVRSVMVEGGSRVITSFLLGRFADFAVLTVAPVFVGGLRAVNDLGQSDPECFLHIESPHHMPLGDDLVIWGGLNRQTDEASHSAVR